MRSIFSFLTKDLSLSMASIFLLIFGSIILNSLDNTLFPTYFIYIIASLLAFWFFSQVDFDIVAIFSKYFYIVSVVLLLLTLIVGQVTRSTVRWIPIGPLSLQPAELIRPFLLVFFAWYLATGKVTLKKAGKALALLVFPVILIMVQPSLGVSILTMVGFVGILLAVNFNKRYLVAGLAVILLLTPLFWNLMAPYQKARLVTFLEPAKDPLGAGYNSLQSVIAAGSGKLTGTGLGRGVQTQLAFLPEKQTDFIFAATAEELGFLGAGLVLVTSFWILYRLSVFMGSAVSPAARAYLAGFFLSYLFQIFVHVGMNLGMLPVTGVPFPLLSAGGSSLLATMIGLGIAVGAYKR